MEKLTEFFMSIDWVSFFKIWGPRVVIALAVLIIGRWTAKFAGRLASRLVARSGLDKTLSDFIGAVLSTLLTVVFIIAALDVLQVETTSLVAIIAAAGLAVGLALKDSMANFASSVMIMLFRPFKAGDYIEGGGTAGTVEKIGVFHTRMLTPDNQVVIVANTQLTEGTITNYSALPTRRISIPVGISYEDNIESAKQCVLTMLENDSRILKEPSALVHVTDFGDSSINLVIRAWVKVEDYWQTRSDLHEHIKKVFDENGISIPFPQRDMRMIKE